MCGIAGFFKHGGGDPDALKRMTGLLAHRGPDSEGYFFDEKNGVALGHRRLSIIDLSKDAHQPMSNEDETLWITYNGEIYNYRAIRDALLAKGHKFKSNSDTEVIIHAYEEWQEGCLEKLEGMFALAIWDEKKQRLFLARDRIGKKSLFYYRDDRRFAFASELQALLALEIPREVDLSAVHQYLTYQYIPAPKSAFKNIFKLPPASYLILENGEVKTQRYWGIDFSRKILVVDEKELGSEVFEGLKKAVEKRLVSDVPLGAFLSGGVDSSVIVALMAGLMKEPVKTFSIGFEDDAYNELPYARQIAKLFKTDHKEFIVSFDALNVLPKLVRHYGEPFADSSALPTYYLSKMASGHVKVALSGDGGDENFAGYDRYYALKLMQWFRYMPEAVRALFLRMVSIGGESDGKSRMRRVERFIQGSLHPKNYEYLQWMSIFSRKDMECLYDDAMLNVLSEEVSEDYLIKLFKNTSALDPVEKAMEADIHSYLPFNLLVKVDIASMANSLEIRCPFLDHNLMEFAASIPAGYKLNRNVKKYILKKAFGGIIPDTIFERPKAGFGVPVCKWFRNDLKDYVSDILLSHRFIERGYFKQEAIKKLLSEHTSETKDQSFKLWSLLMLELWHREFID